MSTARSRSSPRSATGGSDTRDRIVEAAIHTLKERGFSGASARAIARAGGFNQALIFYHFGSVNDLLLAALDATSARRMERYRNAIGSIRTLPELLQQAAVIYREDLESGHTKVLAELISGASSEHSLGPQVVARIEPWVAFAEEAIGRVIKRSPVESLVPVEDVAFAVVALYLGVELLAHLNGQLERVDRLIDAGNRLALLFAGMVPAQTEG